MNTNLLNAATHALDSLKILHVLHGPCDGAMCPHAAIIRELEAELAKAKMEDDPEFQAVDTTGMQSDPHDLADALLRASQRTP